MKSSKKLKVGIIVDDKNQPFLNYDLYKRSLDSNYYSIECLIVQKSLNSKSKNFLKRLINYTKKKALKTLLIAWHLSLSTE